MLQVKTNKLDSNKKVNYLFKFGVQFYLIHCDFDCDCKKVKELLFVNK